MKIQLLRCTQRVHFRKLPGLVLYQLISLLKCSALISEGTNTYPKRRTPTFVENSEAEWDNHRMGLLALYEEGWSNVMQCPDLGNF